MVFDATFQTIGFALLPDPTDEHTLIVSMSIGLPTPFAQPGQSPLVMPVGMMKFPLQKSDALSLSKAIAEAAESIPDPPKHSDLVIANQMPKLDVGDIERKLRSV